MFTCAYILPEVRTHSTVRHSNPLINHFNLKHDKWIALMWNHHQHGLSKCLDDRWVQYTDAIDGVTVVKKVLWWFGQEVGCNNRLTLLILLSSYKIDFCFFSVAMTTPFLAENNIFTMYPHTMLREVILSTFDSNRRCSCCYCLQGILNLYQLARWAKGRGCGFY